MIPSITPPTDNLYKFISLFGLTILLFSVYNFGITYDASAKNKMKIEDVKVELQQVMFKKLKFKQESLKPDSTKNHFRPGKIRRMNQDLSEIEHFIERAHLEPEQEISLAGQISKIKVALDTLYLKQWGYIAFAAIGSFLMIFGFYKWHHKEQKIRDRILTIEHAIKVLDKTYYREDKTNRNVASEVAHSILHHDNPEKN